MKETSIVPVASASVTSPELGATMNSTGTPSHCASAPPRSMVTPRGWPASSRATKNADMDGAATTPTRNLPFAASSLMELPMRRLCPGGRVGRKSAGVFRRSPVSQRPETPAWENPANASPQGLDGPFPVHRARPHPRALGADLRAPARRLGRQRHQDRNAATDRGGRGAGWPARRFRFPEPAPQQAQHDAEPQV